jgi:hypothetical protein
MKNIERFYAIIALPTIVDWDTYQRVIRFIAKLSKN